MFICYYSNTFSLFEQFERNTQWWETTYRGLYLNCILFMKVIVISVKKYVEFSFGSPLFLHIVFIKFTNPETFFDNDNLN